MGAARGKPWLGVVVVPLVLGLAMVLADDWRRELRIALVAMVMGFVFDSAMMAVDAFAPLPYGFPRPLSPLWMVMLWINQGTTLNGCLAWLRRKYWLGALFGGIGGGRWRIWTGRGWVRRQFPQRAGWRFSRLVGALAFPALMAVSGGRGARAV